MSDFELMVYPPSEWQVVDGVRTRRKVIDPKTIKNEAIEHAKKAKKEKKEEENEEVSKALCE